MTTVSAERVESAGGRSADGGTAFLPAGDPNSAAAPKAVGFARMWPEWAAIAAYTVLLAFAISRHEPFSDEAQAWQLARTLPLSTLFKTYIGYEASPGLWHILLWIMTRVHIGYAGMHWVCGVFAITAQLLLLHRSPFPRYLKLALPFTNFFLYQYAVVGRSYVLAPLLLFLIAIYWKKGPIRVAILLGLLANVSLHLAVLSGGLAIVYCMGGGKANAGRNRPGYRGLAPFLLVLAAFYSFAIWTAWPPADLVLSHLRGQSRPMFAFGLASLTFGIGQPWILSIAFWIAIGFCLRARRAMLFLVPVGLFACFSGLVYAQFWHAGLLVPFLVAVLWITWPEAAMDSPKPELAGRAAVAMMIAVQLLWSAFALNWDLGHAYSGDPAAAQFLEPFVHRHARILVTWVNEADARAFDSVGILPYFDHNPYQNVSKPFWWWSEKNDTQQRFDRLLPERPEILLVETRLQPHETLDLNQPGFERLRQSGYRLTNSFCGTIPIQMELGLTSCHMIFQPAEESPSGRRQ